MKISILTLFPEAVDGYMSTSIMQRAQDAGALDVQTLNIRDFSTDKHKNVDEVPYGGGAGMVMQVEPIHRAVESLGGVATDKKRRVIVMTPKGKRYTQRDAERLASYDELVFICGRYEGIDERVAEYIADEELSIGDFVLTGGELSAMVIADSVVRLLPDVLGNDASAVHESHSEDGYLEHPHYARPAEYNGWSVPEVLRGGNHAEIDKWRQENSGKSDGT